MPNDQIIKQRTCGSCGYSWHTGAIGMRENCPKCDADPGTYNLPRAPRREASIRLALSSIERAAAFVVTLSLLAACGQGEAQRSSQADTASAPRPTADTLPEDARLWTVGTVDREGALLVRGDETVALRVSLDSLPRSLEVGSVMKRCNRTTSRGRLAFCRDRAATDRALCKYRIGALRGARWAISVDTAGTFRRVATFHTHKEALSSLDGLCRRTRGTRGD